MGWWEDAWNDVGEAFEDVGEAIVGVVEDVVEAVVDVVEDVAEVVVDIAEGVADFTMDVLDATVFDPVDFLTGGMIDVDYDDGNFTAALDFGIASVGVAIGDAGFSAESSFDIGLASGSISYDSSEGLAMSGSLGAEWGPLPYAEGHLTIGANGDVSIGGELQATLPFLEIDAGFDASMGRGPDGTWGAAADVNLDIDTLHGDLSLDAAGSVSIDADGHIIKEGDVDLTIDRDGDGDDDLDDMVDGGVFGGKGGRQPVGVGEGEASTQGRSGEQMQSQSGDLDGDGDVDADDVLLGKLAESAAAQNAATSAINQGLDSESTRPDDDGFDDGFDDGLDVRLDFVSPPPVGPNGPPTMDLPGDEFAPADEFEPIDPLAIPVDATIADPAIPEPLPEPPPPSDFAVEIEAIDDVEVEADEMWDDLG